MSSSKRGKLGKKLLLHDNVAEVYMIHDKSWLRVIVRWGEEEVKSEKGKVFNDATDTKLSLLPTTTIVSCMEWSTR